MREYFMKSMRSKIKGGLCIFLLVFVLNLLLIENVWGEDAISIKILIENTVIEYEEGFNCSTSLGLLKIVNYTEHRLLSSSGAWASSNEDVATIDNFGNLTPVSEGKTTISVEYEGYTDSVEVEVVKAEFTGIGCQYYDVKEKDHVILEEGEEINLEYFRHSEAGISFNLFLISTRGKKYYLFAGDITR